MPPDCSVKLKCLVFSHDRAQLDELTADLSGYSELASVDVAAELSELRHALLQQNYDFAVIALNGADDRLPPHLLRYPDLHVLAVVRERKTGSLESWLRQGAADVVSLQRPGKFRHALYRMIDGCVTRYQLRKATQKLATQHTLQRILLDSHAEALLLWQNGEILESNARLGSLLGCKMPQNQPQGSDWQRWLSARSYAELHKNVRPTSGNVIITSTFDQNYNAQVESLVLNHGPAQLLRIDPNPIENIPVPCPDDKTDSVTGLLRREHFLKAMEYWLQSVSLRRYTVVQINIDEPDAVPGNGRASSTLQELLVYRVANLLQQQFRDTVLIGRTGPTALTLVSRDPIVHSRDLAMQVRHCLGSVGGLVNDPTTIRVKTLTAAPSALSPDEVLMRMEQHPLVTRRVFSQRGMNRRRSTSTVSSFSA